MRLIDADELKAVIIKEYREEFFGSVLWNILNDIPTAYDIDKVVEELEEMTGVQYDCEKGGCQFNDCIYTPRAIEIVKQGKEQK